MNRRRDAGFKLRVAPWFALFPRCLSCTDPLRCVRRLRPVQRAGISFLRCHVARDFDPVAGQWYRDLEDQEVFQVLSVDPDEEILEIQYEDGDVEEIDLDTWHELDLEKTTEPEGWSGSEDDEDDLDMDDDEDWDEDEDEDDDWDDDDDMDDEYDDRN